MDMKVNILIVDDNEDNLLIMSHILNDPEYNLLMAKSGKEALRLVLNEDDFALIFLDVRMPGMDGIETASYIRKREKTSNIPIIFLTAYDGSETQMFKGYSLGAVDFLIKPIAAEILRSKVSVFVDLYRKNKILKIQEEMLKQSNEQLEIRVHNRTIELDRVNQELRMEIAERQKVEDALRASETKFRRVFESDIIGVFFWDDSGLINSANDSFCRISGFSLNDISEKKNSWDQLVPEEFRDNEDYALKSLAESSVHTPVERSLIFQLDQSIRHVLIGVAFMTGYKDQGLGLVLDITERKIWEMKMNESLKEKELLLKEIHHRVKNNLQIISSILHLQSGYIQDPKAYAIFDDSQSRIKSMALIHETLYQSGNLARIDFQGYLNSLIVNLFRSYGANNIKYEIIIENVELSLDSAIPCGLIINELVTNSIKYAFQGREGMIIIRFEKNAAEKYELTVSDNGVGLPSDFDYKKAKSLGFQLVVTLSKQINAILELDSTNGTCFKLQLPATPIKREGLS